MIDASIAEPALDLLFHDARSVYDFSDTEVTDEHLRAVYDLWKLAPTSSNVQPLRLLVVRSQEARARLGVHMSDGNRAKTLAAPLAIVLAADTRAGEGYPAIHPERPELRERWLAEPEASEGTRFNASLQFGFFVIAARAYGLAVGPVGGFTRRGVDAEFFTDSGWRSFLVANVGFPSDTPMPARLPRRDYDTVVREV
jgi:3-hydroxypropanoate dehydrogenase